MFRRLCIDNHIARTAMAKARAFAFIGPALWNQLPPSTRSSLLTGGPSASFRCLKPTFFFSLGISVRDWCALRKVLCKFIDTIQYCMIQCDSILSPYTHNTRVCNLFLEGILSQCLQFGITS